MKDRNIKHSDNWATPKAFYDVLDKEFGFDFDPCPLQDGYIPLKQNGLIVEWGNMNFVNPPYSRLLKEAFIKKAVEFQRKGKYSVMLLPVSTSTKIFHSWIITNATEIRFIHKRIKFCGTNTSGETTDTQCGMHDSMVVVFGKLSEEPIKIIPMKQTSS